MSDKYVIIRDMAAGNSEIGEMWQETKIFDASATLAEVMAWAEPSRTDYDRCSKKRIQITRPHVEQKTT